MIELVKDIWEIYDLQMPDVYAICITTNGFVKSDGRAVMGRGLREWVAYVEGYQNGRLEK